MGTGKFFGLVLFLLLAAGCSGSDGVAAANNSGGGLAGAATSQPLGEAPPSTVEEECRSGAQQVTARLETFVGSLGDISPQDFLAQEKIKGLAGFQNDVAQIIAEIANQNSTLCDLDGLQALVDEELAQLDNQSLLSSYLVSTIRFGGTRERSDVLAGPDDDFDAILGLLDNGSSITLTAGTYAFDTSLLIQRDLTIVGDDVASTIIQSTAADAAIAVFGEGKLTLRDLTVQHVGESSSSVILAFGAPIDIEDVMVSGGRGDEDTGGGNGILLSDGVVNEDGTTGTHTHRGHQTAAGAFGARPCILEFPAVNGEMYGVIYGVICPTINASMAPAKTFTIRYNTYTKLHTTSHTDFLFCTTVCE